MACMRGVARAHAPLSLLQDDVPAIIELARLELDDRWHACAVRVAVIAAL